MQTENTTPCQDAYPYNLLIAIKGHTDRELPSAWTADHRAGLDYVLSTLDERERGILLNRYQDKLPRSRTAEEYGITAERVRQIEVKACRKLKRFPYWYYLTLGIAGYARKLAGNEYGKGYSAGYNEGYKDGLTDGAQGIVRSPASQEVLNRLIESLNLSVRAYNCLKAAGCKRIGDVVRLTEEEISTMRQLGKVSAGEIALALNTMDIRHTAWEKYLL